MSLPAPKRKVPTDVRLSWRVGRSGWEKSLELGTTGSPLAPDTEDTWKELQSKRPQQISGELPQRVLEFNPDTPLALGRSLNG